MYKTIKLVVSVALIIFGLTALFQSSIIGGALLLMSGVLILPFVSKKVKNQFSQWQKKPIRIATVSILACVGFFLTVLSEEQTFKIDDRKQAIIDYLKSDTTDKSIQNIKTLIEVGRMFDYYNSSLKDPNDGYLSIDTVNEKEIITFNPFFKFQEMNSYDFLYADEEKGLLTEYRLLFELDENHSIVSKKTAIIYENSETEVLKNDEIFDINKYFNKSLITKRKEELLLNELVKEEAEAYQKKKQDFEDNCLSGYDGSFVPLKDYVKKNMHDPSSFEHVETRYLVEENSATIVMSYRGKNAFGGIVLNTINAKVSIDGSCTPLKINE